MSNYFGLYFGNSTASIAQFRDDGKVEILANEAGERVTAAVVVLTSSEQVVGSVAGATSYSLAPLTVRNNKLLLDTTLSPEEVSKWRSESRVKIEEDLTYNVFETDKKPLVYTPEQVAALVFKKLYGIGLGAAPGQKKLNCVICVPRHWTAESRNVVFQAASEAGWNVKQIINDPPAALMAYKIGFEKPPVDQITVVYRLGGVSCESTVIQVQNGFYTILGHVRRQNIGGQDIIASLTEHLAEEFKRKFRLEPSESRKSMWKLKIAATAMLHTLSTLPSCSRFIESVCEGVDFNVTVSRARLDALITPLVPQFTSVISESLLQAAVQSRDVSKVVLCGGALKIPKLKSVVASMFNCEMCASMNPDEVCATGAAQQAGLIAAMQGHLNLESDMQIPFLTNSIPIKVDDKEILIEKNFLPTSDQITMEIQKPSIAIIVGESLSQQVELDFETAPKEIEFHFKITTNDELEIEAIETENKVVKKGTIQLQR